MQAVATKDAMAKCLYGALFDWIVLQVNHALLSKRDTFKEHQVNMYKSTIPGNIDMSIPGEYRHVYTR